jgi:hypothetical protein
MGDDLPDPRPDGVCAACARKGAVTQDRRFCAGCLRQLVARLTPMVGRHAGRGRSDGHRQAREGEPSPWQENAVRNLEDGPPG